MTTIPSARDDNDADAPWRCPKCGGDETWFDRTEPMATRCSKCGRDVSGQDDTPTAEGKPRWLIAEDYVAAVYWPLMRAGVFRDDLCANGQAYAALLKALADAAPAAPSQAVTASPPSPAAALSPPEGNDSDDGFFCDGCSAVIQEAAAWIGNSAYCKDCVGRLCESYFKEGTKPRRKRAQHAHPPSASPQSAPEGFDQ